MALEVGSVFAKLEARLDGDGFSRFDRALDQAERRARNAVTARAGLDVDRRSFDQYDRQLDRVDEGHRRLIGGTARVRGALGSLFIGGAGVAAGAISMGLLAKGTMDAVGAFEESEKVARRQALVIRTMGQDAGASADHVNSLASALMRKTGVDDDTIISGANVVRTFRNIRNEAGAGNDVFDRTTKAALDMSSAMGTDLQSAAIQLGKALNDPVKGAAALGRTGAIAKSDIEELKKMAEAGAPVLEQQRFVLKAVEDQFRGTAASNATATQKMSAAFGELQEAIGRRLAPYFNDAVRYVHRFTEGMMNGTGAGGRFVDTLSNIGQAALRVVRQIRDVVAWFQRGGGAATAATAAIAGLAAGFAALTIVQTIARGIIAMRAAILGMNAAMAANPVGAVIVVLTALATALVIAYKRSDTFRRVVDGAFDAASRIVAGFAKRFLSVVDVFLGGLQKMAEVAGHLPGVGGKFDSLAEKIGGVRDGLKGYRDELDKTDKAHKDARSGTDKFAERIGKARDAFVRARDKLKDYKVGTDEWREAAKTARKRSDDLKDAVEDMGRKANRGKGPVKDLKVNVDELGNVTVDTAGVVGDTMNSVLKQLGAKPVNFHVVRRRFNRAVNASRSDAAQTRATGGMASPFGGSSADDHLLIDPHGRAVAAMSGTEGILNRPQMGIVNRALGLAQRLGALPWGSLGELWQSGMRHYQAGGLLEGIHNPGLSIKNGRPVPPSFWGASTWADHRDHIHVAAQNVMALANQIAQRFGLTITSTTGGGHAAGSYHYLGMAADLGGAPAAMMAAARWLAGGGGGGAGLEEIAAPLIAGPAGAMRTIAQRGGQVMTNAANRYLSRQTMALGGGDTLTGTFTGQWNDVLGQVARQRGWNAGDWRWIVSHESGGNPNAVNPSSGATGLGQMLGANVARYDGHGTPVQQILGMGRYIADRYGTPTAAKAFWQSHGWYGGGGLLRRFAGGGILGVGSGSSVSAPVRVTGTKKRPKIQPLPPSGQLRQWIRGMRPMVNDRVDYYEQMRARVEDLNTRYSVLDRRYNLSDEELIDETTGEVDTAAVARRVHELGMLRNVRDKIVQSLTEARKFASKVAGNYRRILRRISGSLKHADGKDRRALRGMRSTYRERVAEWEGNVKELRRDLIPNAVLDFRELSGEIAEVQGTQAEPQTAADTPDAPDLAGGTPDTPDAPDAGTAAPTADQIAEAAAQMLSQFNEQRATLFGQYGSNFTTGPRSLSDASNAGAGSQYYGAGTAGASGDYGYGSGDVVGASGGGAGMGAGKNIVQNIVIQQPPPDPHIWARNVGHELAAL